jgi:hypothetical protein
MEKNRTYTRVAVNALTLRRGGKENEKLMSSKRIQKVQELWEAQQEKLIDEMVAQTLKDSKEYQRKAAGAVPGEEEGLGGAAAGAASGGVGGVEIIDKENEAEDDEDEDVRYERELASAEAAQEEMNRLIEQAVTLADAEKESGSSTTGTAAAAPAVVRAPNPASDSDPDALRLEEMQDGMPMITGEFFIPAEEKVLQDSLDSFCPPLKSTPLLQDKGLRLVFSVGIDAVLLDADTSARLQKISLTASDMITPDDSADAFEQFYIPEATSEDSAISQEQSKNR